MLSNILNAIVPFLLLPILTNNLSPDEYGKIAMFQTLVSGLLALTGLNSVGSANRFFYDKNTSQSVSEYNGACFHILFISSGALFIVFLMMHSLLSKLLHIPHDWLLWAIFVSSCTFIIQLRLGQWQIREEAFKYGLLQVSQSIFLFFVTLLLLFSFKQGAVSRINAMSITGVLYVVISVSALYREGLLSLTKVRLDYIKDALMFGVPLIPHVIGIFLLSSIDRVLISDKLGVAAAGIYMVGVQLSLGMIVVFDAINKAFVPWLFRTLAENHITKLNNLVRFTYLYFIVVFFLGILSFWVGPYVVKFIVGDEYLEATGLIGWLCLGQAFTGMYLMVTNYLFYKKRTGLLSLVTITCGILNIMLMVYAMEFYGLVGVSIAFAFSMCIRFIATWLLALRVCGFSWLTPIMLK